jgi:hypothetical protein
MLITHVQKILYILYLLIFNFAPLNVLPLGRVPHVPHPCYGSDQLIGKIHEVSILHFTFK